MKPVTIAVALSLLFCLGATPGARADGFDGAWLGGATRAQNCGPLSLTISVHGDALKGQVSSPKTMGDPFDGTVKPDGSFTAKTPDTELDGKFEATHMSGKARLACGTLDIFGQKMQ
ncbi:MAG TPA: hypothetical protein VFA22_11870 [Stellaceae bacterium]|nr:hypothetical protein [Stellaceae bacterium]